MGGKTAKLTDLALRKAKPGEKLRKLSDGRGLQLWLMPKGVRYWRLEYRFNGKKKLLSLGVYPDVTAEKARMAASSARELLRDGHDPSEVRKQTKLERRLAVDNTFASIAEKLVAKKRQSGKAAVTISKMEWILGKVNPVIGSRPINAISTPDIVRVLSKEADANNLETARRMRTVVGEVFRFAMQHGITNNDPVSATRGVVATPKAKHHAAILDPGEFGELLRHIDDYAQRNVVTGAALKLLALLYPRPGELRQAQWSEFNLENAVWDLPAERMKLRQTHIKALPHQAVAILRELQTITGPIGNVFPAVGRSANCMSENTLNAAMRRMGVAKDRHSSHGFRATASTLINASNMFSPDAIERSLAHQDNDAVRRAYARGSVLEERQRMAQWWADYLDKLRMDQSAKVLQLLPIRRSSQ